eukprot:m.644463 g.644463  ORF g.644463 m.644463 type:complete len:168 (+) comp58352_c0_seq20:2162-2665(+)
MTQPCPSESELQICARTGVEFGIGVDIVNDNIYHWQILFSDFDPQSLLFRDLQAYASKYQREPVIELHMLFPQDYPTSPPFVRVIRPRFKFLTGHITIGGSVCTQLLTRSGWVPTASLENVLVQLRAEIMSDPNAQLDKSSRVNQAYDEHEAKQAFQRMCRRYGWTP